MNVFVAAPLQRVWVNPRVLQANLWPEVMLGSPVTPWCRDQDRVQIQPFVARRMVLLVDCCRERFPPLFLLL